MAEPWESDPIAEAEPALAANEPWASDPVVAEPPWAADPIAEGPWADDPIAKSWTERIGEKLHGAVRSMPVQPLTSIGSEDSGFFENAARLAGERATDLAGSFVRSVGRAGQAIEDKFPIGGFQFGPDGVEYLSPEEWQRMRFPRISDPGDHTQDRGILRDIVPEALQSVDLGGEQRNTPEQIKEEFAERDVLGTAGAVAKFGGEQFIQSIPDMAWVLTNLPTYIAARSDEIAEQRAKNKGLGEARIEEQVEALPYAMGSALLERIGAKGVVDAGAVKEVGEEAIAAGLRRVAAEGGKAARKEGATEFFQEGVIEYVGEKHGTDAGMSVAEGFERGAFGAIGGAVGGGGAGTVVAGAREVARPAAEPREAPATEAEPAQLGEQIAEAGYQDATAAPWMADPVVETEAEYAEDYQPPQEPPIPPPPTEPAEPQQERRSRAFNPEQDSLLEAVAKLGGLNREEAAAQGIDPDHFKDRGYGIKRIFTKGGDSLDGMRERLEENGYEFGGDVNGLLNALQDNLMGTTTTYAAGGVGRQADREAFERDFDQYQRDLATYDAIYSGDPTLFVPEKPESAYDPEADRQARTIKDLYDKAAVIDANAADAILEKAEHDSDAAIALWEIINGRRLSQETPQAGLGQPREVEATPRRGAPDGRQREADERRPATSETRDIFGEDTRSAQEVADETRRRDARRNTGQESAETGDPSDLFSEARRQRDIEDAPESIEVTETDPADLTPDQRAVFERARESRAEAELDTQLERDAVEVGQQRAKDSGMDTAVNTMFAGARNAPVVEFTHGISGIPAELRKRTRSSKGTRTEGLYDPKTNRVFILTDSVTTPERAAWVAAHEIAGHRGLHGVFNTREGKAELNRALTRARQNRTVRDLANTIREQRTALNETRATEEAVAELSAAVRTGDYAEIESRYGVTVPTGVRSGVKAAILRFLHRIRSALIRLARGRDFSDADVRKLIEDSWRYVREGETREASGTAEARSLEAFHGTPHDVDRFSTAKIGTGEGAQVFGWGLYFAENPSVAGTYRLIDAEPLPFIPEQVREAVRDVDNLGFSTAGQAISNIMRHPDWRTRWDAMDASTVIDDFVRDMTPGNLYTVDIDDAAVARMLDWDKPMSEQAPAVLDALRAGFPESFHAGGFTTGRQTYKMLAGSKFLPNENRGKGQRGVSEYLASIGIPGIKYLDQGSRNAGGWHITPPSQTVSGKWMVKSSDYNSQGLHFDTKHEAEAALAEKIKGETRNLVVFDDSVVTITHKNGKPVTPAQERAAHDDMDAMLSEAAAPAATRPKAKKRPGDRGYAKLAQRAIDWFNDRVGWRYGVLGKLPAQKLYLQKRYLALGKVREAHEIGRSVFKALSKASAADTVAVYDYMTTQSAKPNLIKNAAVRDAAVRAKSLIDQVGRRLVDAGLLSPEAYRDHAGSYLPRLYLKHLLGEKNIGAIGKGKKLSDMGYLKKRKDIPKEVREVILGEITDPAFLASFGLNRTMRDLALLDFLKAVAANRQWVPENSVVEWRGRQVSPYWLRSEARALRDRAALYQPEPAAKARKIADRMDELARGAIEDLTADDLESFQQIPDTSRYGALRGMWVRKEIYDDIVGAQQFIPEGASWVEKVIGQGGTLTKITQWWKLSKVALNPPTQIRNFLSNMILVHLSGVPMHRVYSGEILTKALKSIITKDKYFRIATKYGLFATTFSSQELRRIEDSWIALQKQKGGSIARLKAMGATLTNFASDAYSMMEAIGKIAKLRDAMEREGKSEADAMIEAHEALFDYSLVPRWVQYTRNSPLGIPFLTFQYKVLPQLAKTAIKHPLRFAPYVALAALPGALIEALYDVDDDDVEKLRNTFPEWMREKGHMLLLPWKDSAGKWQVLDFGYIVPWGMFSDVAASMTGGDPRQALKEVGFLSGPVNSVIAAFATNVDPFTGREIVERFATPKERLLQMLNYMWSLSAPGMLTEYGGVNRLKGAIQGDVDPRSMEPPMTAAQAAMRMFGINTYPVDPEASLARNLSFMQWELRELRRKMNERIADPNLTDRGREKVVKAYTTLIENHIKRIEEYAKSVEIHPNLSREQRP